MLCTRHHFSISVRSDGMRSDLASTGREPRLTPGPPAFLVAWIQQGAGKKFSRDFGPSHSGVAQLLQICHAAPFNHMTELIGWTVIW